MNILHFVRSIFDQDYQFAEMQPEWSVYLAIVTFVWTYHATHPSPQRALHKVTKILMSHSISNTKEGTASHLHGFTTDRRSETALQIAAAITSNIEDFSIRAAICIITSDNNLAEVNPQIAQALQEHHWLASLNRSSFPDPSKCQAAQFHDSEIVHIIRSVYPM